MFASHNTGVRSAFITATVAALLIALASNLHAQSPLTVQPSTGRVGVGTTNPNAKLDVRGAVWVDDRGDACCAEFRLSSGGQESHLYGYSSGRFSIHKYGAGSLSGEAFSIQPNGNVGIGNANPVARLDVRGGIFVGDRGDGCCADFRLSSGGQETHLYGFSSGRFGIHKYGAGSASGEVLSIVANGNVGVGTQSPKAKLDLGNSGGSMLVLNPGSATNPQYAGIQHHDLILGSYVLGGYSQGFLSTGYSADSNRKFHIGSANSSTFDATTGFNPHFTVTSNGNVGIGTTTPTSRLEIIGTFSATTKNFQIDHPLEPDKKHLVHSALEGPEVAVYYRGQAELVNGEVVIELPSYFEALTRKQNRTVQLTSIKGWAPLYVADEIEDGRFTIRTGDGGNSSQRFYWEVKAVRADVVPLIVEKEKADKDINIAQSPMAIAQ